MTLQILRRSSLKHSVAKLQVLNKNRINVISDNVLLRAAVKFADTG